MTRIIAYDLCRLFIGPYFATPRGIDRVDLAMANHVFTDPDSPNVAILPTPLGVRTYPARTARRLVDHLLTIWGENADGATNERLDDLIARMRGPAAARGSAPLAAGLSRSQRIRRSLALLRRTGVSPGRAAATAVPPNAVYVNLGQLALAVPPFFTWLRRRPDVACALMLHDTIPLDHPDMVTLASVAHHARMIQTAATYADCLIFSTAFARDSVDAALVGLRHRPLPSLVRSLPVPVAFTTADGSLPELADQHYFVVVSTIEPRKNFGLLLAVWDCLIATMGREAPHLVIIGTWGREADRILAPLAASPRLRERVHQVSGLSSPTLARLMAGCAAVLSPSLAEGFGLPLLEGIAMGAPTIASDIPSHREIASGTTILLRADDRAGWAAAVAATPPAVRHRRPPIPAAMTEAAYCADVTTFLDSVPLAPWGRNATL